MIVSKVSRVLISMYLQKVYFYLLGDTSLHLIFINFLPLFYILFCKTMRPLVSREIKDP